MKGCEKMYIIFKSISQITIHGFEKTTTHVKMIVGVYEKRDSAISLLELLRKQDSKNQYELIEVPVNRSCNILVDKSTYRSNMYITKRR